MRSNPTASDSCRVIQDHDGDLLVTPGRTEVRGRVRGDVVVAGAGLLFVGRSATVSGTVRLLRGAVAEIRGKAGNLEVEAGGVTSVQGTVLGYLHNAPGSTVVITGTVCGHLTHDDQLGTRLAPGGKILRNQGSHTPAARRRRITRPETADNALVIDLDALAALDAYARLSAYFDAVLPVGTAVVVLSFDQIDQLSVLHGTSAQAMRTQLIRDGLTR